MIEAEVQIEAGAMEVWEALTNPEITRQYFFNCEVLSDWKKGSPIKYIEKKEDGSEIMHVKGEILETEPGKILRYTTWGPGSGLEDKPENYLHVTYKFSESNGITEVIVIQDNFLENDHRRAHTEEGWLHVLNGLKAVVEK